MSPRGEAKKKKDKLSSNVVYGLRRVHQTRSPPLWNIHNQLTICSPLSAQVGCIESCSEGGTGAQVSMYTYAKYT
jgi:hypothetical protein